MELVRRADATRLATGIVTNGGDRDDRDVFHVTFDPDAERVSRVVAESVAAIQNCQPEELEPLYEAVESDALDDLLAADERRRNVEEVQFAYEGMVVTVEPDGDLWLQWR